MHANMVTAYQDSEEAIQMKNDRGPKQANLVREWLGQDRREGELTSIWMMMSRMSV